MIVVAVADAGVVAVVVSGVVASMTDLYYNMYAPLWGVSFVRTYRAVEHFPVHGTIELLPTNLQDLSLKI